MKVLVRANSEDKPFSADNYYFNLVLEDNKVTRGTDQIQNLWTGEGLKGYDIEMEDVIPSKVFSIVDFPDTPITVEELFALHPELLL
jgi:hypothetical protein